MTMVNKVATCAPPAACRATVYRCLTNRTIPPVNRVVGVRCACRLVVGRPPPDGTGRDDHCFGPVIANVERALPLGARIRRYFGRYVPVAYRAACIYLVPFADYDYHYPALVPGWFEPVIPGWWAGFTAVYWNPGPQR